MVYTKELRGTQASSQSTFLLFLLNKADIFLFQTQMLFELCTTLLLALAFYSVYAAGAAIAAVQNFIHHRAAHTRSRKKAAALKK